MSSSTPNPPTLILVEGIQVSGYQCFEGRKWREAITNFLFGIWKGDDFINRRPKMMFDNVTLRLMGGDRYIAYGTSDSTLSRCRPEFAICVKDASQNNVEAALIRFVKNNRIKRLVIIFPKGEIMFTKGPERGDLVVEANNLPSWEDVMKSSGYNGLSVPA